MMKNTTPEHLRWHIPLVRELFPTIRLTGMSVAEFSKEIGYSNTIQRSTPLGSQAMRDAIQALRDHDVDIAEEWHVPTLDEVEAERQRRGIQQTLFSNLMKYESNNGWSNTLQNDGDLSLWRYRQAKLIFDYYHGKGYPPAPHEVNAFRDGGTIGEYQ